MIRSMTGFGRAEAANEDAKITVEMKAVNHRYLDLTIKLPRKLNLYESAVRSKLKEKIERGKVDVFVSLEDYAEERVSLTYHPEVVAQYMEHMKAISEQFGIENHVEMSDILRLPEVFTEEQDEDDQDELLSLLMQAVDEASDRFSETRAAEGENLKNDLIGKLDHMASEVDFIESRAPKIIEEYRRKLEEKVKDLLDSAGIDDNRIAAEVTIYADKVCTDEEMVRLRSHIGAVKDALIQGGSVGRRLDFLAQEMNREANTTLSKANDLEVADAAISLKTEIEKIREQIQNLE